LNIEDYVVQPVVDVSPPKWHLGHTTWFFENFILGPKKQGYQLFNKQYCFVFNSYYETVGNRVLRTDRGNLTRPSVEEIINYRNYVDEHMLDFLNNLKNCPKELGELIELGLQHEQQHQELLFYDIKYILGHNPLFPAYQKEIPANDNITSVPSLSYLEVEQGNYQIGTDSNDFHFDNEEGKHQVYLHDFAIANRLISNGEYLEFMESGGYESFQYWLSEGWAWVSENKKKSPLYWHRIEGKWHYYTLQGLKELRLNEPVAHISLFEADAYAKWKDMRLANEFEWEIACKTNQSQVPNAANFVEKELYGPTYSVDNYQFYGDLWEWTNSAYLPYPYFKISPGAIGEYNGKFMINQMVLKGGSYVTPKDHIRPTYRNFFHPHLQWQFAGIRLAKYLD
jgi:ergothioneine biosynthesis protein EgtB